LIEIRETERFHRWLEKLRDTEAKARILIRLRRLSLGLSGDARPVGESVSELRIDHGGGYRVYYTRVELGFLLLVGGTKRTQNRDIRVAIKLARKL
jgi:putative addiction module killer protein